MYMPKNVTTDVVVITPVNKFLSSIKLRILQTLLGDSTFYKTIVFLLLTISLMNIISADIVDEPWFDNDKLPVVLAAVSFGLDCIWLVTTILLCAFFLIQVTIYAKPTNQEEEKLLYDELSKRFGTIDKYIPKWQLHVFVVSLFVRKLVPALFALVLVTPIYTSYYTNQIDMLEIIGIPHSHSRLPMDMIRRQEVVSEVFDQLSKRSHERVVFLTSIKTFTTLSVAEQRMRNIDNRQVRKFGAAINNVPICTSASCIDVNGSK